jgi:site-specific DNA-methyltransferase (adenine-specific)
MLKLLPHFTSLGVHLKRARKDRKLTQSALAQQAQLSIDTLRLLENGSGNLSSFWAVLNTLNLAIVGRNLPAGQHMGEQMTTLRKRKGLSQRELMKLVPISQPTLIELERHAGGRLQTLDRVLAVLGVEASLPPGNTTPWLSHAGNSANTILQGDCLTVLPSLATASIDLIMTSPPFADARKHVYGGVPPDAYVEWFLPISQELYRVLKPAGSFVLNLKEKVHSGERHPYVLELILALKQQGWLWTEEYVWHKKNCMPGKYPDRLRDAWARCLHFTKQKSFKMGQDAVLVPIGNWAEARNKGLNETDNQRKNSGTGNMFGKTRTHWVGREMVLPSNVLHLATECGNKQHPAAFPLALPSFFIKLFTEVGDVVLDPFLGSETTVQAAACLGRDSIGIEIAPEYVAIARARVGESPPQTRPVISVSEQTPKGLFEPPF